MTSTRSRPAEPDRALGEVVLHPGRLLVMEDLLRRGLPDVDHGEAVEVTRCDLRGDRQGAPRRLRGVRRHRSPPCSWRSGEGAASPSRRAPRAAIGDVTAGACSTSEPGVAAPGAAAGVGGMGGADGFSDPSRSVVSRRASASRPARPITGGGSPGIADGPGGGFGGEDVKVLGTGGSCVGDGEPLPTAGIGAAQRGAHARPAARDAADVRHGGGRLQRALGPSIGGRDGAHARARGRRRVDLAPRPGSALALPGHDGGVAGRGVDLAGRGVAKGVHAVAAAARPAGRPPTHPQER